MRYPVVNLGSRLDGMLEDYENEINDLKAKLNPGGYSQPGPTPVYTPPPPPRPPVVSPNPITPGGQAPPVSVATGYPTVPAPQPPVPQPEGIRTFPGACKANETWTPTGCKPNVASVDRYIGPARTPQEPPIPPGAPPLSVATGYPTSPGPTPLVPPPPAAAGGCGPNETWTPTGCKPNVATPGGGRTAIPGSLFSGGEAGGATAALFGLGAPILMKPIRLRGYR